jgi:hypothetical protein
MGHLATLAKKIGTEIKGKHWNSRSNVYFIWSFVTKGFSM